MSEDARHDASLLDAVAELRRREREEYVALGVDVERLEADLPGRVLTLYPVSGEDLARVFRRLARRGIRCNLEDAFVARVLEDFPWAQ